jgi:hypothetical protein
VKDIIFEASNDERYAASTVDQVIQLLTNLNIPRQLGSSQTTYKNAVEKEIFELYRNVLVSFK